VLPLTSSLQDAPVTRIDVAPSDENGLRITSQIAIDRPQTLWRPKLGPTIDGLDNDVMLAVHQGVGGVPGIGVVNQQPGGGYARCPRPVRRHTIPL
jgi:mRNA interferase MazF